MIPMDQLLVLGNEYESSRDCSEDNHKLSYYEELLEDLQQMETEIDCSIPKLKDKMDTLKFEVRYIMPYMTCHVVTSAEAFEETKRRFRIEGRQERLIKFVEHMIEQTLLVRPNATDFYHDTCVGEYNWGAFADSVLENFKYAQSLDDNYDVAKSIEESLRFVRNFVMLVEKRKFGRLNNIDAKIRNMYKCMVSVSRDAALILQLFMPENYAGLNDAMKLRISEVQEKSSSASLEAQETYYDILSLLKLYAPNSCSVNSETIYGLIDSLQKDLMEVITDLHLVKLSREEDIRDMINEMEFLKCILSCWSDGLIDRGKLNAIATHVDVLAFEAESAVYASAGELKDLDDHRMHTKVTSLVAKINQTKHELRQTNKTEWSSLNVLLDHIEEPEVMNFFHGLIKCIIWNFDDSVLPYHVQLQAPVDCFIQIVEGMSSTDANVVISLKDHVGTVLRDLTVLKCILIDPLVQYYDQQEFDELLNDIGAGMAEAGVLLFFRRVFKSKMSIFFGMNDVIRFFSATVRKVYMKYSKLSPSKLPATEMGSLNILLANLKKMNNSRQIRELDEDLQVCNSFLGDSDTSLNQDELGMIKGLRTRILSLGCKLTNALDIFDEVPDWFFEMRISSFIEEVKVNADEINNIRLQLLANVDNSNTMRPKVEAKPLTPEVIGFKDEEDHLIKQLTTGSRLLEVISIVGMAGLGKTTLAMKVYEAAAGSFHCSAWCYVSQNYQKKGLLLQILNEIEGPSEGIEELSDEELAVKLYQCLMKKKDYLIVLDDVWHIEAWNDLRMCFPQGNYRNRILLTSRYKDVGLHAATSDDSCVSLNLLSMENSRLLLEYNIFGSMGFPEHLREIGTEIADRCGRLPLSLVLMAGVLKNIDENKEEWQQVAENLDSLVQHQDVVSNTLELSYKHLPDHLKQCFLYCGALISTPISCSEIRRSKLVQLWVAERLIDETNEHRCLDLEDAADCCLMDLISRSLLIVSKKGSDGQIRSCRVHDLLRDFCIRKGNEEQFLLTRLDVSKTFPNCHQRLSICLHMLCLGKHLPWLRLRTRSFIHSECDILCMFHNYGEFSFIFDKFRLLHVLDLESANMGDTFPESIIKMSELRYLAIGGLMDCIPSSINKLSDLETVIIKGGKDVVRIPDTDTVFGLKKLRHLIVSPHIHFNTKSLTPTDCLQLQTLETVMFCRCEACKDAIKRLPKLRKLKCIFRGSIWYDGFPALDSVSRLEFLKASYSGLSPLFFKLSLPILPTSLKKITLSKFELPWSEMEKIAVLPLVEYLKLQNGAFSGKKWVIQNEFPSLKYLRLDSLDFEEWEASDDHFPCLERLIVRGCKRLKEIPPEFSDVGTLSCIEIDQCGRSVGDSAVKIEYEQRNYSGNKQFKAIIWRIEEMVFNEEQANKEFYLSCGIFLAFQFVLAMSMDIRSSH